MKRIFIANRGEIARRVIKTASSMGIETVAVYSEADRGLPYTKEATKSVPLNGFEPGITYLNSGLLLEIAKKENCDALHPGYGFLSENSNFVDEVTAAGIKFIGPNSASMRALGGKIEAKEIALKLKVPTLESLSFPAPEKSIDAFIKKFGFPLLIKASGGGGGRGMRVVREKSELASQLKLASDEALKFFKDERVFIEPYLETPRHIEVQAFGDSSGYSVALGERDCSMQRKYQKIIEESPAPLISSETRETLFSSAEKILSHLKYEGAATVEFLYSSGKIYFLEVNTRLQVEHPVTEMVTGLDLVELQIRIARGESLKSLIPKRPSSCGHAIEIRICAEDPSSNFQPSTGRILEWGLGSGVRIDAGFDLGSKVTHFYDSLIAKAIIHGTNRDDAINKSLNFIDCSCVLGITTNLPFVRTLLNTSEFRKSEHSVHLAGNLISNILSLPLEEVAGLYLSLSHHTTPRVVRINHSFVTPKQIPNVCKISECEFSYETANGVKVSGFYSTRSPSSVGLFIEGNSYEIDPRAVIESTHSNSSGDTQVRSPLPGKIIKVLAQPNSEVKQGDILFLLESMKMEHPIRASKNGIIESVKTDIGKVVEARQVLAIFANN